jgi:small subunit ribosomal protein S4
MAVKAQGMTGTNLLRILESRLDNVVYRAGYASSRAEARQLVRHNHFTLNGHKANIPSILLKAGDVVAVAEKSKTSDKIKSVIEANSSRPVPKWLDVNADKMDARIVELPNREDIDLDVEEHYIVEYYSR